MAEDQEEVSALEAVRRRAEVGKRMSSRQPLPPGDVRMWTSSVRGPLRRLFGPTSEVFTSWPTHETPFPNERVREVLLERVARLDLLIESVSSAAARASGVTSANRVFIGHGRSPVWRELKDFLAERLHLPWDEFNRESTAGYATTERLEVMLNNAAFAFLIMTGEDEHADESLHARENVVHEVGLFQGRLGMKRAIVLREEGCQMFSNIHGLTYIGFPKSAIKATFEDVRAVLEREGILRA